MRRSLRLGGAPRWFWALLAAVVGVALCWLGSPSWAQGPETPADWPPLQSHPLPPSLSAAGSLETGDYFEQVEATPAGYLVWSSLPVKVYLEPAASDPGWSAAIRQAMQEWSAWLPLVEVASPETADIRWQHQRPPFRVRLDRQRRELIVANSRAAETRFEIYWQPGSPPRLAHRFTILMTPHQSDRQTLGTARHELGHALGIWGHSADPGDVLYAEQVREPPLISPRDRNTLRKIYQQPTRLGWPAPSR